MPHPDEAADTPDQPRAATPEAEARRRAALDRIFGDVLPDTTRDERTEKEPDGDDWYTRNRPPHHGG
ncbi:hypothetical protein ACFPM7_08530 [Actinokineospora guangxiensis]|uniref:Uncharacterized protein n=1 Tax=Actinokineospora guangxiensis TaxID=1490288 RepID=A0ABW0EI79_9PSEU